MQQIFILKCNDCKVFLKFMSTNVFSQGNPRPQPLQVPRHEEQFSGCYLMQADSFLNVYATPVFVA